MRKGQTTGKCKVCAHPDKVRLEMLAAGGASQNSIARKYAVSVHSLNRHMRYHVSTERRAALLLGPLAEMNLSAQIAEEAQSILDHHRVVRATLYGILETAVAAGDTHGAALLAGKLTDINVAISKLTGELASSPLVQNTTNNLMLMDSPIMHELQDMLVKKLAPFPDAARAVLEGLEALEARALEPVATPLEARRAPALTHEAAPA